MFPEYRDLITRLKSEGTHQRFLHLFDRHNELDHEFSLKDRQLTTSTDHRSLHRTISRSIYHHTSA